MRIIDFCGKLAFGILLILFLGYGVSLVYPMYP